MTVDLSGVLYAHSPGLAPLRGGRMELQQA